MSSAIPPPPLLIALDWGTSRFRAYLVASEGAIIDTIDTAQGILAIENNDFERVLLDLLQAWLKRFPQLPLIAAGMIGSRQGWHETTYAHCPASRHDIAQQLVSITITSGHRLCFVPGICYIDASTVPDVIRGEETQIFGALSQTPDTQLLILPGTHSKWAFIDQAQSPVIAGFATFMTGELFNILCQHSILGRLMDGQNHDEAAFCRGLHYAADHQNASPGLLKKLFSARTLGLFAQLPAAAIYSYLSGLLIGTEINEGLAYAHIGQNRSITIVGSLTLAQYYQTALAEYGLHSQLAASDCIVHGLYQIAIDAGLLES